MEGADPLEGWWSGVGDEAECGFGWVGVGAAGGAGPFEGAAVELPDVPGGVVFQGVVPFAEVCEVAVVGGSAFGGVDRVVQVALPGGLAAAGESAVFVAGAEEAFEGFAGPVAVDGEDVSGDG